MACGYDLESRLRYAERVVLDAAEIIARTQAKGLRVSVKPDGSKVTNADIDAEMFIRDRLSERYPYDGFDGEESSFKPADIGNTVDSCVWHCDPIDGTNCFIEGGGTASTVLSLSLADGLFIRPVLSVVHNFSTEELYSVADGVPALKNGVSLEGVESRELDSATAPTRQHIGTVAVRASRKRLTLWQQMARLVDEGTIGGIAPARGSIAYMLCRVADGASPAYVGRLSKEGPAWDIVGGAYILRAAGGAVRYLSGEGFGTESKLGVLVAARSADCYTYLVDLLRQKGVRD